MRYPIFFFIYEDRDDELMVFSSLEEHREYLVEVDYLCMIPVVLDSDGRLLDAEWKENHVEISDPGGEPDPERLRVKLIAALRAKGEEWSTDAPLDTLIQAAAKEYTPPERMTVREAIVRWLRSRLRRPTASN